MVLTAYCLMKRTEKEMILFSYQRTSMWRPIDN